MIADDNALEPPSWWLDAVPPVGLPDDEDDFDPDAFELEDGNPPAYFCTPTLRSSASRWDR